jgi:hypothetical protein
MPPLDEMVPIGTRIAPMAAAIAEQIYDTDGKSWDGPSSVSITR